jgi:hypothetical protein
VTSTRSGLAYRSISKQEWRFVWLVIVALLLLTSIPYLYGYLSSPADKQFMGLMLDIPDHGQYLSWWRSFQSSLLARNKLTPEPNEPLFFNLLWWVLAQASRWTGLGYAPVFQVFRWIAGGSCLWAAYRLISCLLPTIGQRRVAFLLFALSSGLGWMLVVLKYTLARGRLLFPLDVYVAEGNTFLCILGYPHFALALTFISLTLEFVWRGWKEERTRTFSTSMFLAGLLALLLGWMHAYDLLIIYGVMATWALFVWLKARAFPWRLFWGGLIVCLMSCSGAIYSVFLTARDPLWKEVLAQFANAGVYTPAPLHLFVLFGFPLPLALAGAAHVIWHRHWDGENLFVLAWFLAGALLNYIPTDFQIHMLNSWQIPIMILATKGLYDLAIPVVSRWVGRSHPSRPVAGRTAGWFAAALILLVLPTNLYLWSWRFVELARHDYPYYLYHDDVAALDWLRGNTNPDEVVLSSITVGQYVPALSGNTAFLAHWAQTISFYDKQERVARFFDPTVPDRERIDTVTAFGVDYVLYGPAERDLGGYDPSTASWMSLAFSKPRVQVYAVCVGGATERPRFCE